MTTSLDRLRRNLICAARAVEAYSANPTAERLDEVESWAATLIPALQGLGPEPDRSALAGPGPYRVRMTALNGTGAPIADRELAAIPAPGDEVNAATGRLIVGARAFNFDPAIPADVILFMASPNEGLDGSEPRCTGCTRPYDEHDREDLACPSADHSDGFHPRLRYTAPE